MLGPGRVWQCPDTFVEEITEQRLRSQVWRRGAICLAPSKQMQRRPSIPVQHHPQIREAKPQRNATRHSPFRCQGVFLRTGSFNDPLQLSHPLSRTCISKGRSKTGETLPKGHPTPTLFAGATPRGLLVAAGTTEEERPLLVSVTGFWLTRFPEDVF